MQILDLVLYKDELHRLLEIKEYKALIVNCIKFTMPIWVELSSLKERLNDDKECFEIVDENHLSPIKKKQAHDRYTLIAPVLPFVAEEQIRSNIISKIAEKNGLTKQTIRKYLCLFLVYQNIGGLVSPDTSDKKVLSNDEKNFRWALNKYFYTSFGHTLKDTYLLMLKEKYSHNGTLLDLHPPFHRFRYYYQKNKKIQNYYISRDGLSNYQRNHRPLLGKSVRDFATSIGMGMIDSTILDIYLINEEGQLVGRPILTACIDAFSGMCCGYALSWEGGVYSLKNLFNSIIADKVSLCKQFGIDIKKEDWNCNQLPATFVTDKGKEYTSYILEQITDFGINIINLPPYRPDLKSCVEKFFDIIQNLYKPYLKGNDYYYGYDVE